MTPQPRLSGDDSMERAARIDEARQSGRKRIFTHLAPTTRPGDRVYTEEYGWGTIDTAKVAEDFRDAKCTVIVDA